MKRMKYRCFSIAFLLAAMILQNGCAVDIVDDYEKTIDLSGFTNQETSVALIDSAIQQTASEKHWKLPADSNGLKSGRFGIDVDVGLSKSAVELEGVTLLATVFVCPSSGTSCDVKPESAEVVEKLYVDLYGCSSVDCSDTRRVVFHDSSYQNIRAFNRDQFKFKETHSFSFQTFGDECTVRKILNFNLIIDEPDFKVDWDIKYGNITCSGSDYHSPEIEHIHIAG